MRQVMVRYKVKPERAAENAERCDEAPIVVALHEVGSYRALGEERRA